MTQERIKRYRIFYRVNYLWTLVFILMIGFFINLFFSYFGGYFEIGLFLTVSILLLLPAILMSIIAIKLGDKISFNFAEYTELALEYRGYLKSLRRGEVKMNYKINESDSLKHKLDELKDLLDQNIVSQEEYETKRQKIIDNY